MYYILLYYTYTIRVYYNINHRTLSVFYWCLSPYWRTQVIGSFSSQRVIKNSVNFTWRKTRKKITEKEIYKIVHDYAVPYSISNVQNFLLHFALRENYLFIKKRKSITVFSCSNVAHLRSILLFFCLQVSICYTCL